MTGGAGAGEEEAMERAGYSVRGQNARQSAARRSARSSSDNLPRTWRMFALAKTASLCTLAIDGTLRPAACQPARFKSNSVELFPAVERRMRHFLRTQRLRQLHRLARQRLPEGLVALVRPLVYRLVARRPLHEDGCRARLLGHLRFQRPHVIRGELQHARRQHGRMRGEVHQDRHRSPFATQLNTLSMLRDCAIAVTGWPSTDRSLVRDPLNVF